MRGRRWQAQLIDWSGIAGDDDDNLYWTALSLREIEILMPAVTLWLWRTRWQNLPDNVDLDAIIGRIIRRLQGAVMLRQSTDNPCILQKSKDGITWSTLFDFSLCRSPLTIVDFDLTLFSQWNTFNENNFTLYAGAIINIYPQWVYDGSSGDADRDAALCWALDEYVDMMADTALAAIAANIDEFVDTSTTISLVTEALAAIAGAAAALGVYPVTLAFGGLALLAGGLFSQGMAAIVPLLVDDTPYRDTAARDELVCAMLGELEGATPTYTRWLNALAVSGLSANAQTILDFALELNSSEEMFVAFFGLFGDMPTAAAGVGLPCPCVTGCTVTQTFDGTPPVVTKGTITTNNPLSPPNSIEGEFQGGGGTDGKVVQFEFNSLGSCDFVSYAMDVYITTPRPDGLLGVVMDAYDNLGALVLHHEQNYTGSRNQWRHETGAFNAAGVERVVVLVGFATGFSGTKDLWVDNFTLVGA